MASRQMRKMRLAFLQIDKSKWAHPEPCRITNHASIDRCRAARADEIYEAFGQLDL